VHDFEDKDLGKVVPYGVYDVGATEGFVSVGVTSDTAEFAVQSIRTWLERMGRTRYRIMSVLTLTADCGGSNGAPVRLWKVELQKFADETNLTLHVHHYPPGTSKWNKIEQPAVLPHHAELKKPPGGASRCGDVDAPSKR
jgi:Rhodopirellula transposase DDE domain